MAFAERYIDTPEGRVYAELEGDLSRGAVLLATGGPGASHDHYHPWFSRLAGEHAVVYLDYSGCGRSDRVADGSYSVELFARNIEHVRRDLGVDSLASSGSRSARTRCSTTRFGTRIACARSCSATGMRPPRPGRPPTSTGSTRSSPGSFRRSGWSCSRAGVSSLDDRYQALLSKVLPDLEWVDPWGHPELRSPEEGAGFNVDVYASVVGADPSGSSTERSPASTRDRAWARSRRRPSS